MVFGVFIFYPWLFVRVFSFCSGFFRGFIGDLTSFFFFVFLFLEEFLFLFSVEVSVFIVFPRGSIFKFFQFF